MKKLSFLTLALLALSCNNERDSVHDVPIGKSKEMLGKNALCNKDQELPMVTLYGNPIDYPKIDVSSFYSMNEVSDQDWLFNELASGVTGYISQHYFHKRVRVLWATDTDLIPADWDWSSDSYDDTSTETIYYSEDGMNNQYLMPNTVVSPQVGSYIQYRILSKIDMYVQSTLMYSSLKIRPRGILYKYEYNMCGDYIGLSFKVFYKIYP